MHRFVWMVGLAACATEGVPNNLEGVPNPNLFVQAQADFTVCDGAPCTSFAVELHRPDGSYASETSVSISADGAPQRLAPFDDQSGSGIPNAGRHLLAVDGWIDAVQIDVTAGGDAASLFAVATITTPDEAAIALPDQLVVGATPSLEWESQGRPVLASVLFATEVPALRFGFLQALQVETGSFEIGPTVFTDVGDYTISLIRSLDHVLGSGDDHLLLTWSSVSSKRVTVVTSPPN